MQSIELKSLGKYIEEAELYDGLFECTVFRGQPVRGNLIPSIGRNDPTFNSMEHEKKLLRQLRLMGASHITIPDSNILELLVLAQHFGLKTRLLDWTSNPLAALWFACADQNEGDTYVYGLHADNLLSEQLYEEDPFTIPQTRVFQPRLNNMRIVAQHGWFTLHRFSLKANRFVSLDKVPKVTKCLTEWRIPSSLREKLMVSLDRHGVNRKTLFPDLEGLCLHLNWKYAVR